MKSQFDAVASVHCGTYDNWGGGLLVKLALQSGDYRVLLLQSEVVFLLRDALSRSFNEGLSSGDPTSTSYRQPSDQHAAVRPTDFATAGPHCTVIGWNWQLQKDGVLVAFTLATAKSESYFFAYGPLRLLQDYVERVIASGLLIDLKDFTAMSLAEMELDLAESEGVQLTARHEHLDRSRRLLDRNFDELQRHLRQHSGQIENWDLISWTRRHNVRLFMEEALRLLHNFGAAAVSLIDHSRRFYRSADRTAASRTRYDEEVKQRFAGDALAQFIVGLRHYAQHYRLPSITVLKTLDTSGIRGRVCLVKSDLLSFDGWKPLARDFIINQPDELDLLKLVEDYYRNVTAFAAWCRAEWERAHDRPLRASELKRQAYLAKKSDEVVARLRRDLQDPVRAGMPIQQFMAEVLSAEEFHALRSLEASPAKWLPRAVELAGKRYLFPADLKAQLLALADKASGIPEIRE